MTITNIVYMKASPFITKHELANAIGLSLSIIQSRTKEIEDEVKKGRYGKHSIIRDGNVMMLNYLVFMDYEMYRRQLKEKNLRKTVPLFDAREMAKEMGWYADIQGQDEYEVAK